MGSSEDEPGRLYDEEKHHVTIGKGYYQQTNEVTVDQFREFVRSSGYKTDQTDCPPSLGEQGRFLTITLIL